MGIAITETNVLLCFNHPNRHDFSFEQKLWLDSAVTMGWMGELARKTLALNILDLAINESKNTSFVNEMNNLKDAKLLEEFSEHLFENFPEDAGVIRIPLDIVLEWVLDKCGCLLS